MNRMIRCIEGHVFDADKHSKCPECGWERKTFARKNKRTDESGASFGQLLGSMFDALTAHVERALNFLGIKNKTGLSSGIVYASVILLCVTAASAFPGSPLWPGRWGKSTSPNAAISEPEKPKAPEKSFSSAAPSSQDNPSPSVLPPEKPKSLSKKSDPTMDQADADTASSDVSQDSAPTKRPRRLHQNQQQIRIPGIPGVPTRQLLHILGQ